MVRTMIALLTLGLMTLSYAHAQTKTDIEVYHIWYAFSRVVHPPSSVVGTHLEGQPPGYRVPSEIRDSGVCEYVGKLDKMAWIQRMVEFPEGTAFVADGTSFYEESAPIFFGETPQRPGRGSQRLWVVPDGRQIDSIVPYLGFQQPGLEAFEKGLSSTRRTNAVGIEERKEVTDGGQQHGNSIRYGYHIQYDRQGHIVRIVRDIKGRLNASWEFSKYKVLSPGFSYPQCVKGIGGPQQDLYVATKASIEHVAASFFDLKRPPKGTTVQDDRPARTWLGRTIDRPIAYIYADPSLSIEEATAAARARREKAQGHEANEAHVTLIRIALLLIALTIIAFTIRRLVRGRAS